MVTSCAQRAQHDQHSHSLYRHDPYGIAGVRIMMIIIIMMINDYSIIIAVIIVIIVMIIAKNMIN